MELHPRTKVEIVIDAGAADRVVAIVDRSGAKGYTVVGEVSGKGGRGLRESADPLGILSNVMVIVVCAREVAERIVAGVMSELGSYPCAVFVSDVRVVREEQF